MKEERNNKPKNPDDYQFGLVHTDHMLTVDWNLNRGWDKPKIAPYGPISVPINSTAVHYGLTCYGEMNIMANESTGKL